MTSFLNHKETKGWGRTERYLSIAKQTPFCHPAIQHPCMVSYLWLSTSTSCPSIIDQALEIRESNPGLGSITSSSASGSFLKVAYSSWFEHVGKKSWTHDDITRVFGWSSCSQATNIKEKSIKVCPSQIRIQQVLDTWLNPQPNFPHHYLLEMQLGCTPVSASQTLLAILGLCLWNLDRTWTRHTSPHQQWWDWPHCFTHFKSTQEKQLKTCIALLLIDLIVGQEQHSTPVPRCAECIWRDLWALQAAASQVRSGSLIHWCSGHQTLTWSRPHDHLLVGHCSDGRLAPQVKLGHIFHTCHTINYHTNLNIGATYIPSGKLTWLWKSQFLIGKLTICKSPCSKAMLNYHNYQRVCGTGTSSASYGFARGILPKWPDCLASKRCCDLAEPTRCREGTNSIMEGILCSIVSDYLCWFWGSQSQ